MSKSNRDEFRIMLTARGDLTLATRLVGIALSEFMGYDTLDNARPGTARLVELTGFNERTVKRALKALCNTGVIVCVRRGGWTADGNAASTYRGVLSPQVPYLGTKRRRSAADLRSEADARRDGLARHLANSGHAEWTCPICQGAEGDTRRVAKWNACVSCVERRERRRAEDSP